VCVEAGGQEVGVGGEGRGGGGGPPKRFSTSHQITFIKWMRLRLMGCAGSWRGGGRISRVQGEVEFNPQLQSLREYYSGVVPAVLLLTLQLKACLLLIRPRYDE